MYLFNFLKLLLSIDKLFVFSLFVKKISINDFFLVSFKL